ncbi:hypothetical protein ACFQX6_34980 [Streptosporangium lutulentum]
MVAEAVVQYTITVTNTGESPYAAAAFSDSLAGVLDDATYEGDATATVGTVTYADGILGWTGALPVAASAVVTFTVLTSDEEAATRSSTTRSPRRPSAAPAPSAVPTPAVPSRPP